MEVAFPRELVSGNKMLRAAWWKKVRHVDTVMTPLNRVSEPKSMLPVPAWQMRLTLDSVQHPPYVVVCLCGFAGAVKGPGPVCELSADGACRAGRIARRPETAAEVPPFPPLLTRHDLRKLG